MPRGAPSDAPRATAKSFKTICIHSASVCVCVSARLCVCVPVFVCMCFCVYMPWRYGVGWGAGWSQLAMGNSWLRLAFQSRSAVDQPKLWSPKG